MWQMMMTQTVGSYNNMMMARTQRDIDEQKGETNAKFAKVKADAIRRNAKGRLAAAGTEAQEIQRAARVNESDAIQAMASGGTVTDPEMLARLKVKSDANSLAALLQGNREYYGMLAEANDVETGAQLNAMAVNAQSSLKYHGAKSNFMLDAADIAAKGANNWKSPGGNRPDGYDYTKVKTQGTAQGRGGY